MCWHNRHWGAPNPNIEWSSNASMWLSRVGTRDWRFRQSDGQPPKSGVTVTLAVTAAAAAATTAGGTWLIPASGQITVSPPLFFPGIILTEKNSNKRPRQQPDECTRLAEDTTFAGHCTSHWTVACRTRAAAPAQHNISGLIFEKQVVTTWPPLPLFFSPPVPNLFMFHFCFQWNKRILSADSVCSLNDSPIISLCILWYVLWQFMKPTFSDRQCPTCWPKWASPSFTSLIKTHTNFSFYVASHTVSCLAP